VQGYPHKGALVISIRDLEGKCRSGGKRMYTIARLVNEA
jgi:hypothetical protein